MAKEKPHINLVVIGHVDSGKSTSTGHLLYLCGGVDQKTLDQLKKDAEQAGMGSFYFAWALDKLKAERERGITINTSMSQFETEKHHYTIIDAPGHRDYIKNMITSTSLADCSILTISAVNAEYEAGISDHGQTKEHALLAYTLGVRRMIVSVSKMDHPSVNYESSPYEKIKKETQDLLKKMGYLTTMIPTIPISGWAGENIKSKSDKMPWYKGPSLLEAMDDLTEPTRCSDKPLRIPINQVYHISGVGTVPVGRVETGTFTSGMQIAFAPGNLVGDCMSIEMHHEANDDAVPGEIVGFHVDGIEAKSLKRGMVASDPDNSPASEVESFLAEVIIMNHPGGSVAPGYTPIINCHTAQIACKFQEIKSRIERTTGKVVEENPAHIKTGEAGMVLLVPTKPMVVETHLNYGSLGRFAIRDMKQTIGVGVVKQITKKTSVQK